MEGLLIGLLYFIVFAIAVFVVIYILKLFLDWCEVDPTIRKLVMMAVGVVLVIIVLILLIGFVRSGPPHAWF